MYYFSTENGFQRQDLHAGSIPMHAAKVSEKQHRDLLVAQHRGCSITLLPNGQVVALERKAASREEIRAVYTDFTTEFIDAEARRLNYDDARDVLSFIGDPNPTFNKEATHFRAWRSEVWTEFEYRFNFDHPEVCDTPSVREWVASLPKYVPETKTED